MELQTTLVVLLAAGLLVLLAVSTVFVVLLIGLLKSAGRIAQKAELTAGNWAGIARLATRRLGPTAAISLLATLIKVLGRRVKRR